MSDPKGYYKALDVEPGANEAEIKKAYRRHAMRYHPDRPGADANKMSQANEAYALLTDKTRRAQYDRTGSDATDTVIQQRARVMLQDFFMQYLDKGGDDDNPIDIIIQSIAAGKNSTQKQLADERKKFARLQKRLKIIRRKKLGGVDLFAAIVQQKIAAAEIHLSRGEEQLLIFDVCAKLVKEYEFVAPPPPPSPAYAQADVANEILYWLQDMKRT